MTVSKWATIARQCLLHRLSPQQFQELLESHHGRIEAKRLFGALVDCRQLFCQPGDPLISLYIDTLQQSGSLTISDALSVLTKRWNDTKEQLCHDGLVCYTQTLQDLTLSVISPKQRLPASEARLSLTIASRWLLSLARQASREDADQTSLEFGSALESLTFFVASLAATEGGLEAMSSTSSRKGEETDGSEKGLRAIMRQAFELCLPLYSVLPTQLMERISTVLKHINLLDDSPSQNANSSAQETELQALQFQVSIAESQLIASKVGTILFLGNQLFTCSTIDDGTVVNWLASRHHNDYLVMLADLFTGAFLLLKAQSSTPKKTLCMQQCRIFIQSKLPALFSMISVTSYNSFSTEQAIIETWQQIVPLLSDQILLSIGAQFLHACSLLHLLPAQSINQLVENEELVKGLSKGLYTKDAVVDQVNSNHAKGLKFVEELVRSDGNARFVSQAIVEVRLVRATKIPN